MSEKAIATTNPKDKVEIIPLGSDQAIQLSIDIVRNLIAVPTRTGKLPNSNDCLKFISLCRAKHLNPFEGDAYMLGYDTAKGPAFSQITAHQVFLKRAEANTNFDGMQSGVVLNGAEGLIERETDLMMPGEKLVGGWAKVYRKDRQHPTYRRLNLTVFDTGQSRWQKDPAGMIVKCAEADALRSAFPTHLGGLYTANEITIKDEIDMRPEPLVLEQPNDEPQDTTNSELMPATGVAAKQSAQGELETFITSNGFTFSDFQKFATGAKLVADADSLAGFADMKTEDAQRMLRAKTGLLKNLKELKGGQS